MEKKKKIITIFASVMCLTLVPFAAYRRNHPHSKNWPTIDVGDMSCITSMEMHINPNKQYGGNVDAYSISITEEKDVKGKLNLLSYVPYRKASSLFLSGEASEKRYYLHIFTYDKDSPYKQFHFTTFVGGRYVSFDNIKWHHTPFYYEQLFSNFFLD